MVAQGPNISVPPQPHFIHKRAAGLKVVLDAVAISVLLFKFDDLLKEVETQERRFAAVPVEHDRIVFLPGDVLTDERFEQVARDAAFAGLLVAVVTVAAVEVADRPDGLCDNVERAGMFGLVGHGGMSCGARA